MPEMQKHDGPRKTKANPKSDAKGGEEMKQKITNAEAVQAADTCCALCAYCKSIKTPQITGNPVDYVCEKRGAVITDVLEKECDGLYRERKAGKK